MSEFSQRPVGIPFHAALWTEAGGDNIGTARESIYQFSGYPVGLPLPSKDHNTKLQSSGFWLGYLDCNGIRNDDWLNPTAIRQLTSTKLGYTVTDSVTGGLGATPETRTVILFEGTRVETDVVTLTTLADEDNFSRAADPLFVPGATVPGRVWIYITGEGKVRVDSVGVGVVDSPAAGQITLRGVDIDVAGLITANVDPITLALPVRALPVRVDVEFINAVFAGTVNIGGTLDVVGDATVDVLNVQELIAGGGASVPITISSVPSGIVGLVIAGAGDATAVEISSGASTALQLLSGSAVPALTVSNTSTGDGLTVIAPVGDALKVTGKTQLIGAINFDGQTMTGAGGAISTTTVTAPTLDTGSVGQLKVNDALFYTDATPSTTIGSVQFDGFRLSLGDGAVAHVVPAPKFVYVSDDSTVNAVDDITGATITMTIPDTRDVFIELYAWQAVDTMNRDPQLRIDATNGVDTVSILKAGDLDQAIKILPTTVTGGDARPSFITIVWKPTDDVGVPDNTNWTIKARHGVSGGTVETTNVVLRVTYR